MHFLCLGVAQLVACYLGVVEAARSSRVTQTKWKPRNFDFFRDCVVFCFFLKSARSARNWRKSREIRKNIPSFCWTDPKKLDKDSKENLCKATKRNLGRFCYAASCLNSTGDRPFSLSLMRLLLYHSMYSWSSDIKCSTEVNSCKYSNSVFSKLKKFSAQALSRQFPFRDILWRMPFSFSIFW